jgi:hypothetical protein
LNGNLCTIDNAIFDNQGFDQFAIEFNSSSVIGEIVADAYDFFTVTNCRFYGLGGTYYINSNDVTNIKWILDENYYYSSTPDPLEPSSVLADDNDYARTNVLIYKEDGHLSGEVIFCGDETKVARLLKFGWSLLPNSAGNYLRMTGTTTDIADTGGEAHTHKVVDYTAASTWEGYQSDGSTKISIKGTAGSDGTAVDVFGLSADDIYVEDAQATPPFQYLYALIHR